MSDSFADLWNSTTPAKSNPSAQSLASLSKTTTSSTINNSTRRQNDLFSQLSSASASSSRSVTPGSNAAKPLSPPPATTSKVSGGDVFSGLFSSSNGFGSGQSTTNMTMAQRAAQAEKEKREKLLQEQAARQKEASAWEGLDSLGGGGMMNRTSSTNSNSFAEQDDDWGFGSTAKASAFSQNKSSAPSPSPQPKSSVNVPTPAKSSTPILDDDDWGLGDFGSLAAKPANSPAPASSNSKPQGSLWDLDAFNDNPPSRVDSPGKNFDFGNREDGPGGGSQDDDILGDLGKPADAVPKRLSNQSPDREEQRPPLPPRKTPGRSSSPPPHILGQLVEMGFSIQQSRAALAATDTGEDVQAALEFLISNGAAGGDTTGGDNQRPSRHRDNGWGSDNEDEHPPLPKRPTPGRQASNRSVRERERERSDASSPPNASGSRNQTPTNISEQADKLLTQASTIGMSLFNRANAAWRDGKEKVQKAYEERVAVNNSPPVKDGRPRWMQEQSDEEEGPRQRRERFIDEDSPTATNGHEPTPTARRRPEPQRPQRQQPPQQQQEVDLFSSAPAPAASPAVSSSTGAYVSPFRHGRPKPKPAASSPPQKQPHPTTLVLATASALRSSATHKAQGNSHFKLGDFPSAEGAYTRAIDALPSGHALLIPLLNNRALVRLKVGDSKGAIDDAGLVVDMASSDRGVIRAGVDGSTTEDLDVNMGEAIVKAWKRRAEAFESREKWEEAGKDWERVAGAEWAGQQIRSEGVRGAGRCRRALAPPPPKSKAPAAPPRPNPKVPTPPSQALNNLRAANIAAENEDLEKHALKDSVEARLTAWKGGKETNIRALLASLDTVLWPELGVQKWGMSELVTEGQVKIKYMKAIAKVHPDKLSAGNFTVEQKMLAQGVFGALNEAWNAFKQ